MARLHRARAKSRTLPAVPAAAVRAALYRPVPAGMARPGVDLDVVSRLQHHPGETGGLTGQALGVSPHGDAATQKGTAPVEAPPVEPAGTGQGLPVEPPRTEEGLQLLRLGLRSRVGPLPSRTCFRPATRIPIVS